MNYGLIWEPRAKNVPAAAVIHLRGSVTSKMGVKGS